MQGQTQLDVVKAAVRVVNLSEMGGGTQRQCPNNAGPFIQQCIPIYIARPHEATIGAPLWGGLLCKSGETSLYRSDRNGDYKGPQIQTHLSCEASMPDSLFVLQQGLHVVS